MRSILAAFLLCLCVPAFAADERGPALFEAWRARNAAEVQAFADHLRANDLLTVQPLHEILRSASDWKKCKAEPFAVPPRDRWPAAVKTLKLVQRLKAEGALDAGMEVVSAFRPPSLATCADSKPSSAHTKAFALDLLGSARTAQRLCTFWKEQGAAWGMGLSRYDSGRIHVDAHGHRTWGNDCTCESSYCRPCAQSSSPKCGP